MENVYTKAMEIGFANPNGITYSDLKTQIESETEINIHSNLEVAFMKWIFEAFETRGFKTVNQIQSVLHGSQAYLEQGDKVDIQYQKTYEHWLPTNLVIKGSTVKQYLDYIELKESRANASDAKKYAIISIFIAVIAIPIAALINSSNPKPPYDVNIIEDKTKVRELENEIKQIQADNKTLSEELYKAEMLITVYESE